MSLSHISKRPASSHVCCRRCAHLRSGVYTRNEEDNWGEPTRIIRSPKDLAEFLPGLDPTKAPKLREVAEAITKGMKKKRARDGGAKTKAPKKPAPKKPANTVTVYTVDGTSQTFNGKPRSFYTCEWLREHIGGSFTTVPCRDGGTLVADDEGLLKNLPFNDAVTRLFFREVKKYTVGYGFSGTVVHLPFEL